MDGQSKRIQTLEDMKEANAGDMSQSAEWLPDIRGMLGHEQKKQRDFSEELTNLSHHKTSISIITVTRSQRRIGLEDSGAIHTLPGTGLAQQEGELRGSLWCTVR